MPGLERTRDRVEKQSLKIHCPIWYSQVCGTPESVVFPNLWCSQVSGAPKSVVLPGGEGVSCHTRETRVQEGCGTCSKSGLVSGRAKAGAWPGEEERAAPAQSLSPTTHNAHSLDSPSQGPSTPQGAILLPVGMAWQFPQADWHHVSSSLGHSWWVGSLPWGPRHPAKGQEVAKTCAWLCLSSLCPWATPHPFLGVQRRVEQDDHKVMGSHQELGNCSCYRGQGGTLKLGRRSWVS